VVQYLVVALIVALAALYAGSKYLPAGWRRRMVHAVSRGAGAESKMVKWLDTGDSCGSGCDTCGSCETEPAPPDNAQRVIKIHKR
jgi:hypothetical protein